MIIVAVSERNGYRIIFIIGMQGGDERREWGEEVWTAKKQH